MTMRCLLAVAATAALLTSGCCPDTPQNHQETALPSDSHDSHAGHDHFAPGPHGGHLIVLGDEQYHAELTHDEATGTVTVHLLDGAAQNPVTGGPETLGLQIFAGGSFADYSLPATGEPGAYAVVDAELCDRLLHADEVKGRLHAAIGAEEFVGIVDHAAHEHAGHDDGDRDHGQPDSHDDDHHEADDHPESDGDADEGHSQGHSHPH